MDDWVLLTAGLVLLTATLSALLAYSGLFTSVDVKTGTPPIGKAFIAYKDGSGPYNGVGSYFSQSTSIAPDLKQIGLYYDDPAKVPEQKLRWAVGAILAENDETVDETIRLAYEKEKYQFMTLPKVPTSVNSVFPYSTMVSILIAVKRVYPRIGAYIEEYKLQAYPMLEVYFGGNIHFMAPLSNQMDFFTAKALESEEAKETDHTEQPEVEESPAKSEKNSTPEDSAADEDAADEDTADSDGSFEKVEAEN